MQTSFHRFRWLALSAAVMTFLLIAVGGIVRVTGSGLGCPDWPLCYGRLIPPFEYEALIEYSHRLTATLTSPLVLASAFWAWRSYRSERWILWPSLLAALFLVVQVLLGGVTVLWETPPTIVAVHLGNALIILALMLVVTVVAFEKSSGLREMVRLSLSRRLGRLSLATVVTVFLVLVSGAFVTSSGASTSCGGWPLCDRMLWPGHLLGQVHMLHRVLAAVAAVMVAGLTAFAWQSRFTRPSVFVAASATLALLAAQTLIGALNVQQGFPRVLNGLHVATATATWGVLVIAAALAMHDTEIPAPADLREAPEKSAGLGEFLALMKPIIVALLLVTTLTAMIVAKGSWPGTGRVLWTMLGGALAAGGAGALNQYTDRALDRKMARTSRRPLPGGKVGSVEVLVFGLVACIAAFYLLALFVNLLTALLALAGMLYYVPFYSLALKGSTTHNIVIGGGAGAIPPLVGWAAATGSVSVGAFFLFALVFFWTPPHFWALALVRQRDYERAGVPMLPVVYGEQQTRREILLYTVQLIALSLILPVASVGNLLFFICALVLGSVLLYYAWRLWKKGGINLAWRMYRYSSVYLALIFAALVVDTLVMS